MQALDDRSTINRVKVCTGRLPERGRECPLYPPKADIRFTLRHVCFVPLTRRRFIAFLKGLENEGPHTELLIVGDTFGLWELTLVEGIEKLDHIITAHQAIFDQLRATGARIKVTMMVGNHDYDLACNPDFAAQLKVYNIRLDKSLVQQDARSARRNQDRG